MPPRSVTPPARGHVPRAEACNYTPHASKWIAVLQLPSGECLGSLRKPSEQLDPNVTHVSVACEIPNTNAQGIWFPTALTLRFSIPFFKTPGELDYHVVTTKIFAEGVQSMIVGPIEYQNRREMPHYITFSEDYVLTKPTLYKVSLRIKPSGIVCDGLFITPPFPDSGAMGVLNSIQTLFSFEGMQITLYVLPTRQRPFLGPIDTLASRMMKDVSENFYGKFYREESHEIANIEGVIAIRPVVLFTPTMPVSLNLKEMFTKYAMGVLQLNEYQQASALQFNDTIFDMKVFTTQDSDSTMYHAILKPQKEVTLNLREGERLAIKFVQDGMPANEKWQAKVVAPIKHFLSTYICIALYRPRQAHPPGTLQHTRETEILDFVETVLASGDLDELEDEEIFEEVVKHTQTFTVKASVTLSETTARRQMSAIEAMQRGARFNISRNPLDPGYRPWTAARDVVEFAEFLLLRNSVPRSRKNWLGEEGLVHVQHLIDEDQRDVIENLFCNAPEPVGVLIGPAGTGKTVLMSTLIKAHVLGHNTKHIVGSPSNTGAQVASRKIGAFFKADPRLRGKIVMRACNDGPENAKSFQDNNGGDYPDARSTTSNPLTEGEVGVYSADGWYNQPDVDTKKIMREILSVIRRNAEIDNVHDPRMDKIDQTLMYHVLCVLGYRGFPRNDFTTRYAVAGQEFKDYLAIVVEHGVDSLNAAQMRFWKQELKKVVSYTIKNTSVLCGTLTYLAHDQYVENFKNVSTYWTDEAGQASVPDWLNVVARYPFSQAFLLGDHNQLHPVVVGPSPLTGFMRALETSPIQLFLDAHWPSVTLTDNRRSAKGMIDIPSNLFYKGVVKAHTTASDEGKHKWSTPVANLIHEKFSTEGDGTTASSVAFFSSAAPSDVDRLTYSTFNSKNQAFCLNFIEECAVKLGVPSQDIGYTSPYQAQCKRMALSLRKLEAHYKARGVSHAFSLIKCAPIDSYQGGSAKVMIGDYTSSEKLGFMSDRGRNCVLLTRAEDFALYIGNKDIRAPRDQTKNWPSMSFAMAGLDKVCRPLEVDHEWMSHQFA